MHAIKRGWFGQTFALAKSNDSEGRRSRVRRSKEERKAMVEAFIKKYQRLNNGSFPSLNLTHKEVGGSFYTVREIVRDVIQENRVLGPAKFGQEEQVNPQLEQGPLGSIALDPHCFSTAASSGSPFVSEELGFASDGHQKFDDWKFVNGAHVDSRNEDYSDLKDPKIPEVKKYTVDDEPGEEEYLFSDGILVNVKIEDSHEVNNDLYETIQEELKLNKASETENYVEDSTPIPEDEKVETFPVRSLDWENDLDGELDEVTDMANTFSEQGSEKVGLFTDISVSEMDGVNLSHNTKIVMKISDPPMDIPSRLVDEEVVNTKKATEYNVQDSADVKLEVRANDLTSKIDKQSVTISGSKAANSPNDMKANYAGHSNGTNGQLKTEEESMKKDRDVQHGGKPRKETDATLDRINLSEAWESSEKTRTAQGNPLMAAFKALIKAFLKFWTE